MTANTMTERTMRVHGKEIFVAETGTGAPVVLLHGGGPGASGVSNYSRNIAALAENFRVVVPDMPGYGRSAKGVDRSDPFGYLADHIRGDARRTRHQPRASGRKLLRRFVRTATGPGHPAAGRPASADGARRRRNHTRTADGGPQESLGLLRW